MSPPTDCACARLDHVLVAAQRPCMTPRVCVTVCSLVFVSDDDDSASDEDDDLDEAAAHARAVAAMRLMQATLHGNAASATPPTQGSSLPPQQAQQQALRGGNGGDKGEEEEDEEVAVVSSLPQRARINPNAHSPRVAASTPALGGRARAASTPVSPPKGRAMPMARPKRGFAAARRARAGSEAPSPSVYVCRRCA